MIGRRIKFVRKYLKLSQKKFAKPIGVTLKVLSKIESGLNQPLPELIRAICICYDANPIWLQSGEGEMFIEGRGTERQVDGEKRLTVKRKRNSKYY